jgi:hypothetical protein
LTRGLGFDPWLADRQGYQHGQYRPRVIAIDSGANAHGRLPTADVIGHEQQVLMESHTSSMHEIGHEQQLMMASHTRSMHDQIPEQARSIASSDQCHTVINNTI